MKIAFVGKGGSGKSTTSALYVRHMLRRGNPLIVVDADINIHMPSLLGVEIDTQKALSKPGNVSRIKEYLKGTNERIMSADNIVKTTPPGAGSQFLTLGTGNTILKTYADPINEHSYLMHVGTYEEEGIGDSCYHSSLAIFESLLSHTILQPNEWLVTDMVAGTDAFAGSLHAQFDLIVLVVEPSPEGTAVYRQFAQLAKTAGVFEYIRAVGNKVEDEEDYEYLLSSIGDKLIGYIPKSTELKRARQTGEPVLASKNQHVIDLFDKISAIAVENYKKQDERLILLHKLHEKHADADYIVARHGDISGHIDPGFTYGAISRGLKD